MTAPAPASSRRVTIVGAGPAGLMAAEHLARAGHRVTVHEQMPSAGRKFLMAGRGGLNLTHSEPLAPFLERYGQASGQVAPWLDAFSPADLVAWAEGLGQPTFVGSSGRVFPRAMKASPLLRAWLARLSGLGVQLRLRSRWTGWQDAKIAFDGPDGPYTDEADAVLLALGGASWPRLGSDAAWVPWLQGLGIPVTPFRPANMGFDVDWTPRLRDGFAGQPLKAVGLAHQGREIRGEVMISAYGLEGGGIYALSAPLREAIARDGRATLTLDLRPDQSLDDLVRRLQRPRGKDSLGNWLRKTVHLDRLSIALLHEAGPLPADPLALARRIKGLDLVLTGARDLSRAISSAGGIRLDAVDAHLMLAARPGVFVAGEMLDWEAPTGGYLLQASLASGVVAACGINQWLARVS